MKRKNTILLACLGLAFILSFVLNNRTFAGFTDPTGPPGGGGGSGEEPCHQTEHLYSSYSTQDGPAGYQECYNCSLTGVALDVIINDKKVGINYKRAKVSAGGTVRSCKFFNNANAQCNEISIYGGSAECADIFVPDTDTDSDTSTN